MIYNKKQYNQSVGKYKVLSTSAGIGSIIPTIWGGFVMPLSINNWPMIRSFSARRDNNPHNDSIQRCAEESMCSLIADKRFAEFLKTIHHLPNLEALIAVPHLNLNEKNYCDFESHPLFKKWKIANPKGRGEDDFSYIKRFLNNHGDSLTIPAIVYPRWFRSSSGSRRLMTIKEWESKWADDNNQFIQTVANGRRADFVIPVETKDEMDNNGDRRFVTIEKGDRNNQNRYSVLKGYPLEQVQMVLICPNGHISDIPWDRYFAFKLASNGRHLSGDDYADLFIVNPNTCNNQQPHRLQWLPNRSNPDSYGTLKCTECNGTVSLEGIMNMRPKCCGEKPWVGDPQDNTQTNARENCDKRMRWALVTSNSVYYAEGFSSLYIPVELLSDHLSDKEKQILNALKDSQERWVNSNQANVDFFDSYLFVNIVNDEADELLERDFSINEISQLESVIKGIYTQDTLGSEQRVVFRSITRRYPTVPLDDNAVKIMCIQSIDNTIEYDSASRILRIFEQTEQDELTPEKYRYDEYKVFMDNPSYRDPEGKFLCFHDIDMKKLDNQIAGYFSNIKQISTLAITNTQLNFSRASDDNEEDQQNNNQTKQQIFEGRLDQIRALPANQNFGEGLFFSLNVDLVNEYCANLEQNYSEKYSNLHAGFLGKSLLEQMTQYGAAKFYLLHTLSHIIMKELEFSCGYPTASLQERIYYSNRMCGFLIYTAEGSEGSMGGLVAQGVPSTLSKIIKNAIEHAVECSSDPLCWSKEMDQLNYAACFSCCMVSETSCEYGNMGLDRRALVDEEFGFFKDLLLP